MNLLSILALALAMSTDAFAAAIGKGTALRKPQWSEALRTGLIFGAIETVTPLIGYALGYAAADYVKAWDHWIAFVLLGGLGLRMIHGALTAPPQEDEGKPSRNSFRSLALTGLATSIDAMAVGAGLALVSVNIWPVAAAIGIATCIMVTLGVMVGRVLGAVAGRWSEAVGGLLLVGIGAALLYGHMPAG